MSGSENEDTEEKKCEKRLFIGGLFPEVNDEELRSRFGRFGTVGGIEIKIRRDDNGNPVKTFAYIDLETTERDFKKCVNTYNKTRWKGSLMKIQVAKENFLKRLEKERQEVSECEQEKDIQAAPVSGIQSKLLAISDIATAANFNMRGATPGTTIPGEEKWVVGKYGRVLPIIHMKKSGASKILKIDPSKLTHNLRRIKDEKYVDNVHPARLTWQLEDDDNEMSRKRKGEFPEWKPKVKRKRFETEASQDNLQKRVMEVVESDKTYRNSDFEVVPVKGKSDNVSPSEISRNSLTGLSRFDSDPEEDEVNMGASCSDIVVDGYMDLSRFNSDSEDEVSSVSFQKAGVGNFNQAYRKTSAKVDGGKLNSLVPKSSTDAKGLQITGPNSIKNVTALKSTGNIFGVSHKVIDEYSSGLNELNSDKVDPNSVLSPVDSHKAAGKNDDEDEDDSDFEAFVKKQMKNLESAKSETNTPSQKQSDFDVSKQQHNSEQSHIMTKIKTDLKSKVVDGKKTLLAFRGTKFLSSDTQVKTGLTVDHKNNVKDKENFVDGARDNVKINPKGVSIVSYGKTQLQAKSKPVPKSFSKITGSNKLVQQKLLLDEFASGFDVTDNTKPGDRSEDEDDDDSDFEKFVKKKIEKMESEKNQMSDREGSNSGQLKQDERNVDKNDRGMVDLKKNQYHSSSSSSESDDSDTENEINAHDSKESVVVGSHVSKNVEKTHPKRKIVQDGIGTPESSFSSNSEMQTDDDDNGVKDSIYDEDFDAQSNSSSDFEALVSKAVKEVKGSGNSSVISRNISDVSKASVSGDNSKNLNTENKNLRSKIVDHTGSDSGSFGEDLAPDDDMGDELNGNSGSNKVIQKETLNSFSKMHQANHNNNLDLRIKLDGDDDDIDSGEDDSDSEDDDEDENSIDDEGLDGQSDSSSDFEALISKAVKEVQGSGNSSDISRNISEVSKASVSEDNSKYLKNKNTRTHTVDNASSDSDSSSENSAPDVDTGDGIKDNIGSHEVGEKETMNSPSKMHQTNNNNDLNLRSKFNDDVEDNSESDGDDDSDDSSSSSDDKDVAENDNENKSLPKSMKNQTLDYSGVMSESSDSDNDTNLESEDVDSSDEEDSSSNDNNEKENSSAATACNTVKESCTNIRVTKADVSDESGIQGMDNHMESRTSSESEDSSSNETDSDENMEVKTVQAENLNSIAIKPDGNRNKNKLSGVVDFTATKTSMQQDVQLHGTKAIDVQSPVKSSTIQPGTIVKVKAPNLEDKVDIDKKRLKAVKQRQKEALAQKSLIKNALSNLDASKTVNTKIVFDSDSDEEHIAMETDKPLSATRSSKQNRNVSEELKPATKSKTLFDSDDDDEDDDDEDTNRFKIRDEFEGAEGRKLAKLQSRFGHDERFKLDARFIESGSESDVEEGRIDEEDETTRSLKILQSVVGAKAVGAIHKHDKAKKKFKDIGALKYDPSREEHEQFEVKTKPVEQPKIVEKNKKKKKKEDVAMETEPAVVLPEVSKDKFYEVSDSLKNTFAEKVTAPTAATSSGTGFSLLAAFGRHYSDDDDDDDGEKANDAEDSAIPIPETLRTNQLSLANRFKVRDDEEDMASDVDEHKEDVNTDQRKHVEKMDTAEQTVKRVSDVKFSSTFFFMQNDERLKDSSASKHKENTNTFQEEWLGKRRHLIESYKSKHKNLRRKKVPSQWKRGGKRR